MNVQVLFPPELLELAPSQPDPGRWPELAELLAEHPPTWWVDGGGGWRPVLEAKGAEGLALVRACRALGWHPTPGEFCPGAEHSGLPCAVLVTGPDEARTVLAPAWVLAVQRVLPGRLAESTVEALQSLSRGERERLADVYAVGGPSALADVLLTSLPLPAPEGYRALRRAVGTPGERGF